MNSPKEIGSEIASDPEIVGTIKILLNSSTDRYDLPIVRRSRQRAGTTVSIVRQYTQGDFAYELGALEVPEHLEDRSLPGFKDLSNLPGVVRVAAGSSPIMIKKRREEDMREKSDIKR